MGHIHITKPLGLYNGPNDVSEVPAGAMTQAENVVIRHKGSIEPRLGQPLDATFHATATHFADSLHAFGSTTLVHAVARDLSAGALVSKDGVTNYGSCLPADYTQQRMKSAEAQGTVFFATADGVRSLDSVTGALKDAGVPRATGFRDATVAGGGSYGKFLADGYSAAYVCLFGRKDATGRLLLGAPSGREVLANSTGGAVNTQLRPFVPPGVQTGDFVRLYRTESVPTATEAPSEEYYLVVEEIVTSGDVSDGYIQIALLDITPDTVLAEALYTNPSQGGNLQANDPPPFAKDVCLFGDRMLYANTRLPHSLTFSILGVDPTATGSGGIQHGDTLTLAGTVFTADNATETYVAPFKFKLANTGSPTTDLSDTARSLVRVINRTRGTHGLVAFYESPSSSLFGTVVVRRTSLSSASFAATVSARGAAYTPTLPTSGTSVSSSSDTATNRVYYSKSRQPEAVPLLNYLEVGDRSVVVYRILRLRDVVFAFTSAGIFTLSGRAPYRVEEFDETVQLLFPDTAVKLANSVYCYTNQGVCAVSQSGAAIVSTPIERSLMRAAKAHTSAARYPFAVANEQERNYALHLSELDGTQVLSFPQSAFVYNLTDYGGGWTTARTPRTCGLVVRESGDYVQYLGDAATSSATNRLRRTVRGTTSTSFADGTTTVTLTGGAADGTYVTVNTPTSVTAGDVLVFGSTRRLVASVDAGTSRVYFTTAVSGGTAGASGSATVYRGYPVTMEFSAMPGNPAAMEQFSTATFHFRDRRFYAPSATFRSNLSDTESTAAVSFADRDAFFDTVAAPYGTAVTPNSKRVPVSADKQRANYLRVGFRLTEATAMWALNGVSLEVSDSSDHNSR